MNSYEISMESVRKMTLHDPSHQVCPKCGPMHDKDYFSEKYKKIVGKIGPVSVRYWYDKPGILSKEAYQCNYCEAIWGEVLHPEQELAGEAQEEYNIKNFRDALESDKSKPNRVEEAKNKDEEVPGYTLGELLSGKTLQGETILAPPTE